ncbi:HD domain-containing protein [candidate division KSB1 bacterium]|nr:HD domain-containing protein [candidate division KSB1 bacterium]
MKKHDHFAVIDLGTSAIRMVIAERDEKKGFRIIESLSQSIRLGVDTFLTNSISQESALATVKILKKFKRILRDYQIHEARIVATSAVSEAQNRTYFQDYILRQTGFKIEIIESQENCELIFLSVLNELQKAQEQLAPNALLVDLGTGNARCVFIKDGKIIWIQTLKIGSLRLREILHDIDVQSFEFYKVLQAFIHADIAFLKKLMPMDNIRQFVVTGSIIGDLIQYLVPKLADQTSIKVSPDWFVQLYDKYKNATIEQFIEQFNIPTDVADILLPAIIVYWDFATTFKSECIIVPNSSLAEGVLIDYYQPLSDFDDHILASARTLASQFKVDEKHADKVLELCEQIFKQTHSLHKLSKESLRHLRVAALIHDIGHYIADQNHHIHSQYLVTMSPITGITERERMLIALIARNHRHLDVVLEPIKKFSLTRKEQLSVLKLISILRIANALDKSHSGSVKEIDIKMKPEKNQVVFKIKTKTGAPLEKWAFNNCKELFSQLFYTETLLMVERDLG